MRTFGVIVALVVTLALSEAFKLTNIQSEYDRRLAGVFNMLEGRASRNATFKKIFEEHMKQFDQKPYGKMVDYQCDLARSESNPTSAHEVRPGDIGAVASIGDSISAGYGITAESVVEVILNDRHYSWVTGGMGNLEADIVTLPSIVRKFNPGVTGFSYAESWAEEREAGLNVAVGGAIARDLPDQARMLIDKMKNPSYGVDYENDWKVISIMIGGNDICNYCYDENRHSPEEYVAGIQGAIDILYAEVPKAIIMVSNIFDVTPLWEFSDNLICDIIQDSVCGCVWERDLLKQVQRQYVEGVENMINSGRYDRGREDFTAIIMPHFDRAVPPRLPSGEVDRSYWSPDCFHPGAKGHFAVATSLWNQMFEPVSGNRREDLDWQIGTNLVCPTEEDPFIKTRLNSLKKETAKKPQQ